ncbi:MAG: UDP-N-acetylmuramoyl-tripeptide--D-alanyl-D-alanine ligase [Lachnospiraceae bacterium]|nr:UDP-N-acetylmuramoyl-tripeptide--D-alanyl-D-alanine ligase [Lachnospiraceae bacterium]
MKHMTLEHIAQACGGLFRGADEEREREVAGIVLDSRRVESGFCFIATRGERVDGHDFIGQVLQKGALCVICERVPEGVSGNFIIVKDSLQALQDVAAYYRKTLQIPVIGITGSVGKTSTKEFIAGVLSRKFRVLRTEGNYNNEIGVPLTLLQIRPEHEIAVVEMGINHFGEMRRLSRMARPDVCVLTNIGECHLEFLGSREGVLRAKSEIFEYMQEYGMVYLNGDDDMLRNIERVKNRRPVTFGMKRRNDYYADEVVPHGLSGSSMTIHTGTGSFRVSVNLPGEHMIRNALAATAIGSQFGLTEAELKEGIEAVMPVDGRSNIIKTEHFTLIDDCYNANPVSMRSALDMLAQAEGRTVAILGDMGELGEKEAKYHKEVGAYAVQKNITGLICVGSLSRFMYQGGCKAKAKSLSNTFVQYYETKEALMAGMKRGGLVPNGVTVLVKASHSMGFSQIIEFLKST